MEFDELNLILKRWGDFHHQTVDAIEAGQRVDVEGPEALADRVVGQVNTVVPSEQLAQMSISFLDLNTADLKFL